MPVKKVDAVDALETAQRVVKPGTPEMESLLAAGYGMTLEEAQQIVKERDANPQMYPFDVYQKAKAFIAAYGAKPQVISDKPPWRTRRQSRITTE